MSSEHRKSVRFFPEEKEIAVVSINPQDFEKYEAIKKEFKGEFCALIEDEAHKGCSLVFLDYNQRAVSLEEGAKCVVKIGEVLPLRGEVVRIKVLDDKVYKIGIKFLD
ncbi:MAG: hypothetical protein ABUK01_01415 [Leptospirales bacterium]